MKVQLMKKRKSFLDAFFQNIKRAEYTISKQAFSEARQKISTKAFIKLSDAIISWYYNDDFKTYNGYRLCAIDGSVLEISNTGSLREQFGYIENQATKVVRTRASAIYDIENDMILTSKITRYNTGEREMAEELIEKLQKIGFKNDLILFDRGYPSAKLISYIESKYLKYLMRATKNISKACD